MIKFDKLPKYAKDEIKRLEGDVESYKEWVRTVFFKGDTNTVIDRYRDDPVPLPMNARITFSFGRRREITCSIRDGKLHICGSSSLLVLPQATNVLDLEVID